MTIKEFSSGLQVEFRGTRNEDYGALRTTLNDKGQSAAITELLNACTEKILIPGLFPVLGEDGKPNWAKAYSGDRLEAAIAIKIESFPEGHRHHMDLQCPLCPDRIPEFHTVVDLRSIEDGGELLYYPMEPQVLEQLKIANQFEATIDGKLVKYRLTTGEDEERLETLIANNQLTTKNTDVANAWQRIDEVEGVHPNELIRWLEELPVYLMDELEDAFDFVEGGVEVTFGCTCPRDHKFRGVVPFDVSFFRPQRGMRKRRAERRQAARDRYEKKRRT